jgi:hypothetical protein
MAEQKKNDSLPIVILAILGVFTVFVVVTMIKNGII